MAKNQVVGVNRDEVSFPTSGMENMPEERSVYEIIEKDSGDPP